MNKEIELLIKKVMAADIKLKMLERENPSSGFGQIISKDIILEILEELTNDGKIT